jgi:two-component system LytT family response regulator
MDALKAIIVDDERAAIESLSIMLSKYCEDLQIVATASSVPAAKKEIQAHNPDVVFLDIMMPDGTGFDILEELPTRNFEIVFVTAYNHLAVKALKYSAIEFIQKPVCKDDLTKALEKIKSNKGFVKDSSLQYMTLFSNLANELPSKLCLPTKNRIEVVEVEDVLAFKSEGKEVVAYMSNGKEIVAQKNIDNLEDTLSGGKFYRISSGLLINLKHLEILLKEEVIMRGGLTLKATKEQVNELKINYGQPPY